MQKGSKHFAWQLAASGGQFCDFGRGLGYLSMPVNVQCCAAMEGSTSLNVPWRAHLRRTRHSAKHLHQAYLDILILVQRNQNRPPDAANCQL